jgi:hypothetical protein
MLVCFFQFQSQGIDAKPQAAGLRSVGEDVAEVGITGIATGFHPYHAEGGVPDIPDGVLLYGLSKTRPPCARVKFDTGVKQGGVTTGTPINAGLMGAAECP